MRAPLPLTCRRVHQSRGNCQGCSCDPCSILAGGRVVAAEHLAPAKDSRVHIPRKRKCFYLSIFFAVHFGIIRVDVYDGHVLRLMNHLLS